MSEEELDRAEELMLSGEFRAAAALIEKAALAGTSSSTSCADLWLWASDAWRLAKDFSASCEAARKAKKSDPDNQEVVLVADLKCGLALRERGELNDAIKMLRTTLAAATAALEGVQLNERSIVEDVINVARLELATAISELHPNVALCDGGGLGDHLVAAVDLPAGTVLLREEPILKWRDTADDEGSKDDKGSGGERSTDVMNINMFKAFNQLADGEKRVVLDLCKPPMNPSDYLGLYRAAVAVQKKLEADHDVSIGVHDAFQLAIVSKINSHQLEDGWCGLFDISTKLSHSCEPNCMYRDGVHTAIKDIKAGDPLAFSYFGSDRLCYSADVRTIFLRTSHLFDCLCARCTAVDRSRGIRCESGCPGTRFRDKKTGIWRCNVCNEWWRDDEMPLKREDKLGERVFALQQLRGKVEKEQFQKLKDIIVDVLGALSRAHWCYSEVCWLVSQYFSDLMRKSSAETRAEAAFQVHGWAYLWLESVLLQGLHEDCPLILAQRCFTAANACKSVPESFRASRPLWLLAAPMLTAIFPDEPTAAIVRHELPDFKSELTRVQEALGENILDKPPGAQTARILEYMDGTPESEDTLLERWEDYLVQRVVSAAKGSRLPQLNEQLLKAMGHVGAQGTK